MTPASSFTQQFGYSRSCLLALVFAVTKIKTFNNYRNPPDELKVPLVPVFASLVRKEYEAIEIPSEGKDPSRIRVIDKPAY